LVPGASLSFSSDVPGQGRRAAQVRKDAASFIGESEIQRRTSFRFVILLVARPGDLVAVPFHASVCYSDHLITP